VTQTADIFTRSFLDADPRAVAATLAGQGYWVCDDALDLDFADALDRELGERELALNVNDVGPVRYHHQTYFTHALAASRRFFDLVTHRKLRDLCRARLGERFRLKCQRYYQSALHHELPWHTDEKTPAGVRTGVPGIGVVIYLQDTFAGELQVLARSNAWTGATGRTEFGDAEIEARHADDIVTLSRTAGAFILFDSSTLHRTRPITSRGFVRKSVFLQVDADLAHSEKMIVDTQYLDPADAELMRYLGAGLPSGYPSMPPSSIATLTCGDLSALIGRSLAVLAGRALLGPLWRGLRAIKRRVAQP
jgi:hypothetical protein